jgi:hypothetical protein
MYSVLSLLDGEAKAIFFMLSNGNQIVIFKYFENDIQDSLKEG